MKEPKPNEASECLEIRKRGKRGEYLSRLDTRFCERMLKDYPEWYTATDKQVFNETVPFGSNAHRE